MIFMKRKYVLLAMPQLTNGGYSNVVATFVFDSDNVGL